MGKKAKWRSFSKEEISEIVQTSYSNREVARKLGYAVDSGGTMTSLKKMYLELELDTSHFKGQGWNKENFDYSRFRYGNNIKTANALNALIALRGHRCECCGLTEWLDNPISLEVHHEDGDSLNNTLENLKLLCPNCHSLTNNYKGKNINKGIMTVTDDELANALKNSKNIRQALISLGLTAKGGNYTRANEIIQKYQIKKFL